MNNRIYEVEEEEEEEKEEENEDEAIEFAFPVLFSCFALFCKF